jgi:predicted enzyme related to lactoylglutathione lyase
LRDQFDRYGERNVCLLNMALAGGHIRYLFILTRDLARMQAFYADTVGFKVAYAEAGQFAFLSLPAGGADVALYPGRSTPDTADPHVFVVINVTNPDAAVTHLRAQGVAVDGVNPVPYGRAATFKDPEGNLIELHQPDNAA